MSRRPALDGLRALAVLAVMAFHTSPAAHGGFIGVDIFFVISGYLITALLLREWGRTGEINLGSFYLRRLLRLGPALIFMLLLTIPLMLTTLRDEVLIPPVIAVGSVLLYVANWANVAVSTGTGPLTHTWSLSIEEQFYLIWPLLLVALLARRCRPQALARGLAGVTVVVVVARWITWDLTHGEWIYYATTSHCDGLLIGALLAVLLDRRPAPAGEAPAAEPAEPAAVSSALSWISRYSGGAAWLGLAGIAALMATLTIDGDATYEYGLPLVAIFTALVVTHLVTADDGLLVGILSLRPLAAIGMVSYGLYLYHFPVFHAVQRRGFPHPVQHALEISITAVITLISWFLVERPAQRFKDRLTTTRTAAPATVSG